MLEDWHIRNWVSAQMIMVEVEGMKAENEHRKMQGLSQAYGEEAFQCKVAELQGIERELRY